MSYTLYHAATQNAPITPGWAIFYLANLVIAAYMIGIDAGVSL